MHHAGLARYRQGVVGGGRLTELGVHAGEWIVLPCGSAALPAERDYPLANGSNNTHTPTLGHSRLYTETPECAFTRCSGAHRVVLDTDTLGLADLTFLCGGYMADAIITGNDGVGQRPAGTWWLI
jgi:hypothetical protein